VTSRVTKGGHFRGSEKGGPAHIKGFRFSATIVNFNALFNPAVQRDNIHAVTEGEFSAFIERCRAMSTVAIMCGCCENVDSSDYPLTSFGGKRWKSSSA
jgi:hypothetical protein